MKEKTLYLTSIYDSPQAVITSDKKKEFIEEFMWEWEDEALETLGIEDEKPYNTEWFEKELFKIAKQNIRFQKIRVNDFHGFEDE